jgi:hypothetical protein
MHDQAHIQQRFLRQDSTYIITGALREYPYSWENKLDMGLAIFNLQHDTLSAFGYGEYLDHEWGVSIDFIHEDSLFLCGYSHMDDNVNYPFVQHSRSFQIFKTNPVTKEIHWNVEFEGMGAYRVQGVQATNDGGCIVLTEFYDYLNSVDMQRDIHFIKFDKHGNHYATHVLSEEEAKFTMYPNPTHGVVSFIDLPSSVNIINVYSIEGRLVREIRNSYVEQIDLQDLNAGVYILEFRNDQTTMAKKKLLVQ